MTQEELISGLRDIQPPPQPGWWLPASGHLVIALALLLALLGIWYYRRRRHAMRLLRLARIELWRIRDAHREQHDPGSLARALSLWLRQVCRLAFPDRLPAARCGAAWLEFLDQALGGEDFSRGPGRVFGAGVYQRAPQLDAAELLRLCERWLEAVGPRLRRRGRG